jgi:hypothetical protein
MAHGGVRTALNLRIVHRSPGHYCVNLTRFGLDLFRPAAETGSVGKSVTVPDLGDFQILLAQQRCEFLCR